MIIMTARNFRLTEGLKQHIFKRLGKLGKYVNENEEIEVVMETKNYGSKIEVTFNHNDKTLRASSVNEDLYVATDLVVDKINEQIRRNSDKATSFKKESIKFADYPSKLKKKNEEPIIVKRKFVDSKPMFEEEAIEQMELLDHRSFIFFNASTDSVCMLYKRHDGDYGIIETI